jgi:hypothetical protein
MMRLHRQQHPARKNHNVTITEAALNIEPLGSIFVGEKSKEVSMVFGSFPQKKESQVVQ